MIFRRDYCGKARGLTKNVAQWVISGPILLPASTALPSCLMVFLVDTGERLILSCLGFALSPSSSLSYLSPSFLSVSLFPRLKWIMRSLITKTWQLSPRLSPSTRCNAPTSFPTSLIPDTPPTRCLRDVAMERYLILPSLGLLKESRCCWGPQSTSL